jgi:hypothetical protein
MARLGLLVLRPRVAIGAGNAAEQPTRRRVKAIERDWRFAAAQQKH